MNIRIFICWLGGDEAHLRWLRGTRPARRRRWGRPPLSNSLWICRLNITLGFWTLYSFWFLSIFCRCASYIIADFCICFLVFPLLSVCAFFFYSSGTWLVLITTRNIWKLCNTNCFYLRFFLKKGVGSQRTLFVPSKCQQTILWRTAPYQIR